ncbi:MAG: ATP-dependent DNA helicase [Methanosarcinales archaeon]|nr:ATP-dependent DNA helicase [Methanosarcinales archaeon]
MAAKKSKASSGSNKSGDDPAKASDIRLLIEELPISDNLKAFYTKSGICRLYPPQSKAVSAGLLEGKNVLISIPTASGKTLLAELAMLQSLEQAGKCLYVVPLRALASEKFRRFSEFKELGYRSGISTGDLDERDENLGTNDIIVATSEKVDSLIRNETHWLSQISVVVLDEVHLLDSKDRGPTLEIVITKLRKLNPKIQIVALSATIQNSSEVAGWLDAACVVSDWRPTKLYEGVYFDGIFEGEVRDTKDRTVKEIELVGKGKEAGVSLAADTIRGGGQCLVFTNSRKNAAGFAKKAGPVLQSYLTADEQAELSAIAAEVTGRSDTDAAKMLAFCIRMGVAFHHAGLSADQRELVERSFSAGKIKLIASTPTLAAGLNLPARRVIIASWVRYDSNEGMKPLPVMEYKQMAGRAGRPHLDPYGESVLIASKEEDIDKLREIYIDAEPEAVESKLSAENALRTHVLSTVSNGFAETRDRLLDFFKGTFFAYQRGLLSTIALKTVIDSCLDFLIEADMCREDKDISDASEKESGAFVTADKIRLMEKKRDSPLASTKLGSLVSKLYLDPLSASVILNQIRKAEKNGMTLTEISLLHLVCMTADMKLLYMRTNDYLWVTEFAAENCRHIISMPPTSKSAEFEWFLGELKTAVLLYRWISEVPENEISKEFDVGEGDIRQFSETAAWISNAGARLLKLIGSPYAGLFSDLELRLQYGVSVQLLPLLKIRGIGRVRARRLYNAGFKSKESFKPADFSAVSDLIGPKTAARLYEEIGIEVNGFIVPNKKNRSRRAEDENEPDVNQEPVSVKSVPSGKIQKRFDEFF